MSRPSFRKTFISPDFSPPPTRMADKIVEHLSKNYADLQLIVTDMKGGTGYQAQILHYSRLHPNGFKLLLTKTDPYYDDLLKTMFDKIKSMDKFERKQKYYEKLEECLKVEFRGVELTIQEYNGENPKDEEDAWNRYMEKHSKDATKKYKVEPLVRPEGQSFMVRVELNPSSEEFERCGLWVLAVGVGRDKDQAARYALSMLQFKKDHQLLWVNEALKEGENNKVDFFDQEKLKKRKKRLGKDNTEWPSFCDSYKEEPKPERPGLWRMFSSRSSTSTVTLASLKNGKKHKDTEARKMKKQDNKNLGSHDSDTSPSRRKEEKKEVRKSDKVDSDTDASHRKNEGKHKEKSVREGSDSDEEKKKKKRHDKKHDKDPTSVPPILRTR